MSRRPRCPDCASQQVCPFSYGLPTPEVEERAQRGEVILGGCLIFEGRPAWRCDDCRREFGDWKKPFKKLPARSREEWAELVTTMLPAPVTTNEAGELLGGDPPIVVVRLESDKIRIMEAGIEWEEAHTPTIEGRPFATVPFRTPAARVEELIALAWGKRLARYRWCPRCRERHEPEHMLETICDTCAEKVLGVVF